MPLTSQIRNFGRAKMYKEFNFSVETNLERLTLMKQIRTLFLSALFIFAVIAVLFCATAVLAAVLAQGTNGTAADADPAQHSQPPAAWAQLDLRRLERHPPYGVAAALPHIQKQKSGHIIYMASVFGIKMFAPGGTVYCATKAAVRALTEGLRMELHSQNIRCTMISPGAIATELSESSSDEATRKNLREFMKMAIPASAIARAIAYAIEQPVEVEVDEMVIRPTVQDF